MRTYVYAVKDTSYKWVDFRALFNSLLDPKHDILSIKYFTALVTGKLDPQKPLRQKSYIRALQKYIPELTVYYGHFLSHVVSAPLAKPTSTGRTVRIIKTEEKGSDVNLAVHLLNDAWLDKYDCAVIVSNDSDLAESLKLIKSQHRKTIGLVFPDVQKARKRHPSKDLLQHADFVKHIRKNLLSKCQLPDSIPGTKIRKPKVW